MKILSDDTRRIILAPVIRPVPLVTMSYRADEGTRKLYMSDREYQHDGHFYLGLIARGGLSDISYSLKGIGGIATLSSATLRLINATGNPKIPLSASLKDYTLINQDVTIDYLFEPAAQTIRIFSGKIQDVSITLEGISLTIRSTTLDQLQSVPADIATLSEYPNIPLANADQPIPVVFGNMNTPPQGRPAKAAVLAPCMNLDLLTREYTSATRAQTYGDVYHFSRDTGYFSQIASRRTGEKFTVSVTVSGLEGHITATKTVRTEEATTSYYRGYFSPFQDSPTDPGAIESLLIRVTAILPPSTTRQQALKFGAIASFNGTGFGYGTANPYPYQGLVTTSTTYSRANMSRHASITWENLSKFRITATSHTPLDVTVTAILSYFADVGETTFSGNTIFQSISGYKDAAANYADGGVVNAADMVLSSPLDIAHALLRDKRIGMGRPTAQVDRSAIVQDRAKMPTGYRFDFSMNEVHGFDAFSKMLSHGLLRMWSGADGKWKIKPYSTRDAVVGHFNKWNIDADTLRIKKSPVREIYNHFFLRYGWHQALGYYTKNLIRSYHTKRWGTGTMSNVSGANATLRANVPGNTLQSDSPINVGDRIWFDGDYYAVRAAATQTATALDLSVKKEDGSNAAAKQNKPYYLGANFDYRCWQTEQRYGIRQSYKGHESQAIESKYIQDANTAEAFLDALIQYYGQAEDIVTFQTGLGAVALDPGDMISIDHPLLGDSAAARGVLGQAISWPDAAFAITHPTDRNLAAGDVIVLEDADTGACEMIRITSASSTQVTACERGYGNTIPRRWGSSHAFSRVTKKWQITDLGLNVTGAQVTITARSVRA